MICLNPFNPKSDQYLFSPNNFTTFSRKKAMIIYKIITKEELPSSNGCLKINIEFSLFGQFSVPLSFLNRPVIISLLTQLLVKLSLQVCKKWTPWTVEWGGERGLQGYSWLDSAKATLNCFRATCTRIQTTFWNCITFYPDSCRRGLKPHIRLT